jgi:tetratricopeptide (TPR) repeat protein
MCYWAKNAPDEAGPVVEEEAALAEALVREQPTSALARERLALASHNLAAQWARGRPEEAERQFRRAIALREELLRDDPGNQAVYRLALAQDQASLSVFLQQVPARRGEARTFYDQAAANLERLVREDPHDYVGVTTLCQLRVNWSYVLSGTGKASEAVAELSRNLTPLEEVLRQEPGHDVARLTLLRTHGARAQALEGLRRFAEAVVDYERVVAMTPPAERAFDQMVLALYRVQAGDHARGAAEAEAVAAALPAGTDHAQLAHLAEVFALAARKAGDDPNLPESERAGQKARHVARAIEMLTRAKAAAGEARWRQLVPAVLQGEGTGALRDRPEVQRLVKE